MSNEEENKTVKIKCTEDDIEFTIPRKSIKLMGTIEDFLAMSEENGFGNCEDPFPMEISSEWFQRINKFCEFHADNPKIYEESDNKDPTYMCDFDNEYIEGFMDIENNHADLLELYRLAHYLHIPQLRKLVSKKLVKMIYNASCPNYIRKVFGLEPKEEEVEKEEEINE